MKHSTSYRVRTVKGGAGGSTVAAAIALQAAGQVALVVTRYEDVLTLLGQQGDHEDRKHRISETLTVFDGAALEPGFVLTFPTYDTFVLDAGQDAAFGPDRVDHEVLVLRADFVSLKKAQVAAKADSVVLVEEVGRSATTELVEEVLGQPVLVIDADNAQAVARAVDAGTLALRQPKILVHVANEVANKVGAVR